MTFLTFTETSSRVIPSLLFLLVMICFHHPPCSVYKSFTAQRAHTRACLSVCVCVCVCVCAHMHARVPGGSLVRRTSRKCDHHLLSWEVLFPPHTNTHIHTHTQHHTHICSDVLLMLKYEAFQHLSSTVRRSLLHRPHAAFLVFFFFTLRLLHCHSLFLSHPHIIHFYLPSPYFFVPAAAPTPYSAPLSPI